MITIKATGDTTLHTAGKYCEEDILVQVPEASGGSGGDICSSLTIKAVASPFSMGNNINLESIVYQSNDGYQYLYGVEIAVEDSIVIENIDISKPIIILVNPWSDFNAYCYSDSDNVVKQFPPIDLDEYSYLYVFELTSTNSASILIETD